MNNFSSPLASAESGTGVGALVGEQSRTQDNLTFAFNRLTLTYSFVLLKRSVDLIDITTHLVFNILVREYSSNDTDRKSRGIFLEGGRDEKSH